MLPSIWRNRGSLAGPSLDDFIERVFYGWPKWDRETDLTWMPRVDVHETDKEVVLDVELPGMEKKDISVEVKDNVLRISGERKQERKTDAKDYSRIERHYGKFERSFGLPETIDQNKVSAEYKNGVLRLTLQKTEKALPKQINVEIK